MEKKSFNFSGLMDRLRTRTNFRCNRAIHRRRTAGNMRVRKVQVCSHWKKMRKDHLRYTGELDDYSGQLPGYTKEIRT